MNKIKKNARYYLAGSETFEERVMHAMQAVDREVFVSAEKNLVLENSPQPIGYGQTIPHFT